MYEEKPKESAGQRNLVQLVISVLSHEAVSSDTDRAQDLRFNRGTVFLHQIQCTPMGTNDA